MDRMLQADFLRPDAMPIRLEQTLFLLMLLLYESLCSKNPESIVIVSTGRPNIELL